MIQIEHSVLWRDIGYFRNGMLITNRILAIQILWTEVVKLYSVEQSCKFRTEVVLMIPASTSHSTRFSLSTTALVSTITSTSWFGSLRWFRFRSKSLWHGLFIKWKWEQTGRGRKGWHVSPRKYFHLLSICSSQKWRSIIQIVMQYLNQLHRNHIKSWQSIPAYNRAF